MSRPILTGLVAISDESGRTRQRGKSSHGRDLVEAMRHILGTRGRKIGEVHFEVARDARISSTLATCATFYSRRSSTGRTIVIGGVFRPDFAGSAFLYEGDWTLLTPSVTCTLIESDHAGGSSATTSLGAQPIEPLLPRGARLGLMHRSIARPDAGVPHVAFWTRTPASGAGEFKAQIQFAIAGTWNPPPIVRLQQILVYEQPRLNGD